MELIILLGMFVAIMAGISPEFKAHLMKSKRSFVEFMRG